MGGYILVEGIGELSNKDFATEKSLGDSKVMTERATTEKDKDFGFMIEKDWEEFWNSLVEEKALFDHGVKVLHSRGHICSGSNYCTKCGKKLMTVCNSCQGALGSDWVYCSDCGNKVR